MRISPKTYALASPALIMTLFFASSSIVLNAKIKGNTIPSRMLTNAEYKAEQASRKAKCKQEAPPKLVRTADQQLSYWLENAYYCAEEGTVPLRWLRQAAESGNLEAQFALAEVAAEKLGDWPSAIMWMKKAADQGYPDALHEMANITGWGKWGGDQDVSKSLDYETRAGNAGSLKAMQILAEHFKVGERWPKDLKRYFYWQKKLAEEEDQSKRDPEAYDYRQQRFLLGLAYAQGQGVEKNLPEAFRWFKIAADSGERSATATVAYAYANGSGVKLSQKSAFLYGTRYLNSLQKDVDVNCPYNCAAIGLAYVNGKIANIDYRKGATYLSRAIERSLGDITASAMFALASLYENGNGLPKDQAYAKFLMLHANRLGSPDARLALSRPNYAAIDLAGMDVFTKSVPKWQKIRSAAEQGDAYAQRKLGEAYLAGDDLPKNVAVGEAWIALSIKK